MIDVKVAVSHALAFLGDMYKDDPVLDPRLEEVELSDDSSVWQITLSFMRKTPRTGAEAVLAGVLPPQYERQYKVFAVGVENGEVRSMKIRAIA